MVTDNAVNNYFKAMRNQQNPARALNMLTKEATRSGLNLYATLYPNYEPYKHTIRVQRFRSQWGILQVQSLGIGNWLTIPEDVIFYEQ